MVGFIGLWRWWWIKSSGSFLFLLVSEGSVVIKAFIPDIGNCLLSFFLVILARRLIYPFWKISLVASSFEELENSLEVQWLELCTSTATGFDSWLGNWDPTSNGNAMHVWSVVFCSLQPLGLQPVRLLCPWHSLGKNAGVSCHSLLQGILLTQGLNPGLPHCRQTLYRLSHKGSPKS